MSQQENNLTLEINDVQYAYVPNTLKYNDGKGMIQTNVNAAGGGATVVTHARDLENAKGMVSFELRMTKDNDKATRSFFKNVGGNSIRLSNNDTGFTKSFGGMSLTEDPTRELTADGTFELVFEGNQAIA